MYVLQIIVWPRFVLLFAIVLSVLRFVDFDYPFGIIKLFVFLLLLFGHCIVCPSSIPSGEYSWNEMLFA